MSAVLDRPLEQCAQEASELIFGCREALYRLDIEATQRNRTAAALLTASIDEAWSLCVLLGANHQASRFPSLVLYRAVLDKILRGAFFARVATQEELEFFWNNDKMPRRQLVGERDDRLTPERLAALVDYAYGLPQGRLREAVQNHWPVFSGVVHGGPAVVRMYTADDGAIGCRLEEDDLLEIVQHAMIFGHLAMKFCLDISCTPKEHFDKENEGLTRRIAAFIGCNDAQLGSPNR